MNADKVICPLVTGSFASAGRRRNGDGRCAGKTASTFLNAVQNDALDVSGGRVVRGTAG